jgi:hypothetical protein
MNRPATAGTRLDEVEEVGGRNGRAGEDEVEIFCAEGVGDDFGEDLAIVGGEGEVAAGGAVLAGGARVKLCAGVF